MAFNWDTLISFAIIAGLILAVWAKISQQTIVELLRDMRDMFSEQREEVQQNAIEVYA